MNKGSFLRSRRFRYGSMSAGITALVIAAVILINVIFSMLASKYLWYIDMTTEGLYRVSENGYKLLDETFEKVNDRRAGEGKDPVKVAIKFCDEYDNLMADVEMKFILTTALELEEHYPDTISVEYIDIYENPSAVNPYKRSVADTFVNTDVIIDSDGEFRHYYEYSFFLSNPNESTYWAYYGEKQFASGILAVTQAEKPIAALLGGHGETFEDAALGTLLEEAGYEVVAVTDLVNWEIPEECRLMVCYNPTTDFRVKDGVSEYSEIEILDKFLAQNSRSLMVFMSPDSPVLPNFEDYLALWGIEFSRTADQESLVVVEDAANALTSSGTTFIGQYETLGMGASITKIMRTQAIPQKVVFRNAMPIKVASAYETAYEMDEETERKLQYGFKNLGSTSRSIWNIFSSGSTAKAYAAGREVESASPTNLYGLMTISIQSRSTQEDNYGASYTNDSSYVLACGSTDFATSALLDSVSYGNSEVLYESFSIMGKDAVPVSLAYIPFADTTIDTLTAERANRITILLSVIPAVICFGVGVWVLVRRKYS